MSDLIERQAAIHFKVSHGFSECGILYVPYGEVKEYLEQLPSAQSEITSEIVRCRECKRWSEMPDPRVDYGLCERWGRLISTRGTYFCKDGKRRDEE